KVAPVQHGHRGSDARQLSLAVGESRSVARCRENRADLRRATSKQTDPATYRHARGLLVSRTHEVRETQSWTHTRFPWEGIRVNAEGICGIGIQAGRVREARVLQAQTVHQLKLWTGPPRIANVQRRVGTRGSAIGWRKRAGERRGCAVLHVSQRV